MRRRSDAREFRSGCPIASALELVGDRWTLVLLRDLMMGKTRFADFLQGPEAIATNVLTVRLAQMEANGLVTAQLYQKRPKRYVYKLTPKGAALAPVLQELCRWSGAYLPDRWAPPDKFMRLRPSDLA